MPTPDQFAAEPERYLGTEEPMPDDIIERFDPRVTTNGLGSVSTTMEPSPTGDWVRFSDLSTALSRERDVALMDARDMKLAWDAACEDIAKARRAQWEADIEWLLRVGWAGAAKHLRSHPPEDGALIEAAAAIRSEFNAEEKT